MRHVVCLVKLFYLNTMMCKSFVYSRKTEIIYAVHQKMKKEKGNLLRAKKRIVGVLVDALAMV